EIARTADTRFMNPLDLQPLARDHPRLNFTVAHFGAGFLRETLFLQYQCDNISVDTSGSNSWMKYLPYPITLKDVYQKFLDVAGPDKIIFGTDSSWFPRGFRNNLLTEHLEVLKGLNLAKDDLRKIFYANAAYRLKIA
ncbi:MAG: amidohydrolase family protein, partial [Candidatus Ranarchaeia archaeon]